MYRAKTKRKQNCSPIKITLPDNTTKRITLRNTKPVRHLIRFYIKNYTERNT